MTGHTRYLRVSLLSGPRIFWGDEAVQPRTRKGLALLCYLARKAERVSRSRLATMLWPNSESRLGNLRWEIHQLRRLAGSEQWLRIDTDSVQVLARTDIHELEQAIVREDYETALLLSSGVQFASFDMPLTPAISEWLAEERELLATRHRLALVNEAHRLEAAAKLSEARELIHEALESDPFNETDHRTAMRLALKQGDVTAAQTQFETCRRILASEFGLEPTAATMELAAAIESALQASPTVRAGSRLPPALLHPPRLVGREREWMQLQHAWERNQLIFISGPAGIGKTRLAQDFIRAQVDEDSVTVLRGLASDAGTPFSTYARGWRNAFERQPDLLQLLPDWVRHEAAIYLPELLTDTSTHNDSDGIRHLQQVRALNELYRRHLESYSAALVDDTQFFDESSWHLGGAALQELLEDDDRRDCRIIISFRDDDLPRVLVPHLRSLLARGRAVHISLSELGGRDLPELLTCVGRPATEATRIAELVGGNPFCVLELLRHMHVNPELTLSMHAKRLLPDSLRELYRTRLARLSPRAQSLAGMLAHHTSQSDIRQLSKSVGMSGADKSAALAELENCGLVVDFGFANELIRETALQHLPAAMQPTGD